MQRLKRGDKEVSTWLKVCLMNMSITIEHLVYPIQLILTMRIAIERFVVKVAPALQAVLPAHGPPVPCQDVPVELEVSRKIFQLTKLAKTTLKFGCCHLSGSNGRGRLLFSVGVSQCPIFFHFRIICHPPSLQLARMHFLPYNMVQ